MSRSRKHTPVTGNCVAESEKISKQRWNRYFRRLTKIFLRRDSEGALPMNIKKETEVWDGPKDGKQRFNPKEHPRLMRK